MVVRKPIPIGALPLESHSTIIGPSNQSLTHTLNETPDLQVPDWHSHSTPTAGAPNQITSPQQNPSSSARGIEKRVEKPLPMILQPGIPNKNRQELETGFLGPLTSTLSASANITPRSSLDSDRSRAFWEEESQSRGNVSGNIRQPQQLESLDSTANGTREHPIAFVQHDTPVSDLSNALAQPQSIQSNNPFRRRHLENEFTSNTAHSEESVMPSQESDGTSGDLSSPDSPIEMTANLSLADRPFSEYSSSYRPSNLNLNSVYRKQEPEQIQQTPSASKSPLPSNSPTPELLFQSSHEMIHQPPLIPVSTHIPKDADFGSLHPTMHKGASHAEYDSTATKTQGTFPPVADLGKDLPPPPQEESPSSGHLGLSPADLSTVFNQASVSPQYTPSHDDYAINQPAPKPPRLQPQSTTNIETDAARLKEKRTEAYQIKHFNWFDHNSRTIRRSSMLTQNKNGPCPLLALVNALILDAESDSRSALADSLRTREQVSLGLIIESLMDELTSEKRGGALAELPDVDELNRFLLMLHTGMTANPRLASAATPSPNLMDARNSVLHLPLLHNDDGKPGTFEDTQDMRLYGAFGIPLVHGWLAPRSDPARAAFTRSAQTYEDAQTIQFREEELEEKLARVGLASDEQQLLQDISSIKSYLETHPTQITSHGLEVINESLSPGSVAILFRNDHFCTIYKHPDSGQLFALVTDAGYSDKDEVIWESLVDVSGQDSGFFSGDFRPVGNGQAHDREQQIQGTGTSSYGVQQPASRIQGLDSTVSFQDQQQQADADFAMALQLQEEEEARFEDSRQGSGGGGATPNQNSYTSNSRRVRDQEGSRPAIPPRTVRNQGVNRPIDPSSDEAPPPAYEEAAKGKPYLPPLGHPHHSPFNNRSPISGPSTPLHALSPRASQAYQGRMSAFQETSQVSGSAPLNRPQNNGNMGVAHSSARPRDRDKDCIVM